MILNDSVTELLNRMPRKVRSELITRSLRTVTYFRNGSKIVALPNSINLLRGYHASLIIVDEASFFQNDREVFDYVLTPMLATTAGRMVVSSTPWGRDTVFFRINNDPGWEQHHRTWRDARDAGLYRPEFLADIDKIKQTQPLTYVTEYEADFAEEVDTWLTQDILARACSHTLYYRPFEAQDEGNFFLGVDLAEKVDYTAIAVIKKKRDGDLTLTHIHRFKLGTSLAACIGYLKLLGERLRKVHATYVDTTKHGDFIVNDMIQAGVPHPIGITLTQDTKQEAAQILKTRLVEDRLKIPYDRTLLDELNLEKYQLTKTGKISLSHPSGTHDDRFWALALATFAATREVLAPRPIFA
jgi:phage FluMu gp28-like protein